MTTTGAGRSSKLAFADAVILTCQKFRITCCADPPARPRHSPAKALRTTRDAIMAVRGVCHHHASSRCSPISDFTCICCQ